MQARRPDQSLIGGGRSGCATTGCVVGRPAVAESLGLDDEERYDGREFIRFSPLKLESMMPGDEMEIPLDQENATFNMVVDSVEVFPDGNVAWRGHFKDFPAENQVSFTRGIDLTVGNITLPDKQFTVQAQGEKAGWLTASRSLKVATSICSQSRAMRGILRTRHTPMILLVLSTKDMITGHDS